MRLSRSLLFLLPALVLGMVPACKSDKGRIKIAVVTNNPETFWKFADAGARKAAKDFDVELLFRMPDSGNAEEQRQIVRSLTEQGIAGIAVSVIDPKEQSRELKQIAGQLKLVTMDNDAPHSDRICYVGTDNYAAGRAAGRLVREALPQGGDIGIFVGQITPDNARARFEGVVDELAGSPTRGAVGKPINRKIGDKEYFFKQYGNYFLYLGQAQTDQADRVEARTNARDTLSALGDRPDVCMIGLWAYNPPEILAAISNLTFKHAQVVGFDEDDATLKAIEEGRMHASVVQDPFNFGYKSVEILAAEARDDKSKSGVKPIPYRIVTKNGGEPRMDGDVEIKNLKASEFREQLRELLNSVK
jgi:ribose transport system substrate-binding protein